MAETSDRKGRRRSLPQPAGALTKQAAVDRRTNEFSGLTPDARFELATTRIRTYWDKATRSFVGIGRTIVDACFDGDETAALADDSDENALLQRIVRNLGTLEGGPSEKTLSLVRRVVAATRAVRGHFWKVVPYGHKEILVRLPDPAKIAAGAKLAVENGWTLEQTEVWVDRQRAKAGRSKHKRGQKLATTRKACRQLEIATEQKSLDRFELDLEQLDDDERRKVVEDLDRAAAAIKRLLRLAKKKRGR